MNDLPNRYEQLIWKAERLAEEISACEAYLAVMLAFTQEHGDDYEMTTIEDLLNAVYEVESDRRRHLLNVRFETALLHGKRQ